MLIFIPAIISPLFASSILGYTAWDSGLLLVVRALPVIVLTPLFATLAQRGADVRFMLGTGFLLSAGSLAWLALSMTSDSPFGALALPLAVTGIGQSMLLVPLIVGVLTTTPAALNGRISPIITLCIQLGGSIGSATSIAFFDRRTSFHADLIAASATLAHVNALGVRPSLDLLTRWSGLAYAEATTLGFADTMLAVGVLALAVAPAVLFFPRSRRMA
jgi:DHA2 family multidrug resistance protein